MAYVYRHIRLDKNEPFYIGIGSTKARCYTNKTRNKFWHQIVGKTEYRVDVIFDDVTIEEAKEKEIELIALYGKKIDGTGILVNITDGGDGNSGKKATQEEIEARRIRMIENNHFKGKKHSEESKEKMRLAKLGKKRPKEGYIKRAEKMKNYVGENHWCGKMVLDNVNGIYHHTLLEATFAAGLKCISHFRMKVAKGKINYTIL